MGLKKEDKEFLFRKYRSKGFEPSEIKAKLREFIDYLKKIHERMKKQDKSKSEIDERFKREFEKLCQELDT